MLQAPPAPPPTRSRALRRSASHLALLLVAVATTGGLALRDRSSAAAPRSARPAGPKEAASRPASKPLRVAVDRMRLDGDGYVVDLPGDGRAELTLEPRLQRLAEEALKAQHAPYGAAVMIEIDSGRVLALAGRSAAEPKMPLSELALTPWAPAASVFKLVTAAALVGDGVGARAQVCYHGGLHSVEPSNLVKTRRDRLCNTLAYGIARSQNAIIARLAHDHLDADELRQAARSLGFGAAVPFDAEVTASQVEVPSGGLPLARVAAGFWQSTMSPLHGAWLAATVARGGMTPPLHVLDRIVQGGTVVRPAPTVERRALSAATARTVGAMMVGTTEYGTARASFHDGRGRALLPGVAVAGKTGSLFRPPAAGSFLAYSWFVGFAPAARPEVAFAVLLANGSANDPKAHRLARDLLAGYFHGGKDNPLLVASR